MDESAIVVRNLYKSYGSFEAINDLNIDIPKGKITGLLGPNGAGKSTLMRCILGLIKPTKGDIEILNENIKTGIPSVFRHIGSIIEKPDFYTYLSARKNLELLAMISKLKADQINIQQCLDLVNLTGRENDKVKNYSHGMKQRLGIAQCLIHNPEIIILDEPTTGLDPEGIIEFRNLIIRLRDEFSKTILLSSHILSEIELVSDHIIIINKGRLVAQGNIAQMLNEEDMVIYLETDDLPRTESIIKNNFNSTALASEEFIQFNLNKEKIPNLVQLLVENNLKIYRLDTKRGLEELYLNITSTHQ
ncbi:MAG: ABC transporter ATP-binding protein [Saprospiraceae bacterium]